VPPLPPLPPPSQLPVPPDPGQSGTLDDLAACLRQLKAWAGNPSYESITGRINGGRPAAEQAGKTTVVDCFRDGRRRLDTELVVDVVRALHPDPGYLAQWRQVLGLVGGESRAHGRAAAQVRVRDSLPPDLPRFTGRTAELNRLRDAVRDGRASGDAFVISALAGMAGVGKTQLALHVAHRLAGEGWFDRVLFVDLRGFDPDQPPADPAAVLDGFLRLLGLPGQALPPELEARTAAYRDRLAGTRSLVVLDNAADERQAGPLLPRVPGCVTLVTSRRALDDLPDATRFAVDVFTAAESLDYLAAAVPGIPAGSDPGAAERIAARCGHLPLALALVAGHIAAKPGWTLTDHADWLDERHDDRRLETGVELALDVSYGRLPVGERALLRLLAQHPGQDFDAYAAAALAGIEVSAAGARLVELAADHLVQSAGPGRYSLHDLVRAYAAGRCADEDRRADRRAAVTRLFDYYLATTAAAMNLLDPVDAARRPDVPASRTPPPDLAEPLVWLDAERPNLIAMAAYAADHGWPEHVSRLSTVLFRHLAGGHHTDALVLHGHAARAAQEAGEPTWLAQSLVYQAVAEVQLGRHEAAAARLEQSYRLFLEAGDEAAAGRARNNLGIAVTRLGRYPEALEHHREALAIYRKRDDRAGAARALVNIGNVEARIGHDDDAAAAYREAIELSEAAGDELGAAGAMANLAQVHTKHDRLELAAQYLMPALETHARLGNRSGQAWALNVLGDMRRRAGDLAGAGECHDRSLHIFRQTGDRDGQAWLHNSLGEDARVASDPGEAVHRHTEALAIAVEIADREQEARAHRGLASARRELGDVPAARDHYRRARTLWAELGSSEAARIDKILAEMAG
jgi:tetratricopeptide (TPR) repeat protein